MIDFIACDNALLACKQSHLSTSAKKPVLQKDSYGNVTGVTSPYWDFVMSGIDKTDIKIALQILSAKIEEIVLDIDEIKQNVASLAEIDALFDEGGGGGSSEGSSI